MKTLAIDTSTKTQSLALTEGDTVVARRLCIVRTNHSGSLLANIDDMLAQADWEPAQLDLVAVGVGPGAFTGLRVGVATAKGIARGAGAALVGVSSLEATARPISALVDATIFALCDARRGEVYAASYQSMNGALTPLSAAAAMTPALLRQAVDAVPGPVVLVGNGLRAHDELRTWDRPQTQVMAQPWDAPSSVSIAMLAARHLAAFGPDDIAALEPDYVRVSDAEMNVARRST